MESEREMASVLSLNVGMVREISYRGKSRTTAIYKEPVAGRQDLVTLGFANDRQADLINHGGERKAVYAFCTEDIAWWERQLHAPLAPGTFGENLTIAGMRINDALIGEQFEVGDALLAVTQPRFPCWKLGHRMGDARYPRRFLEAGRAGMYLRVLREGSVAAGDQVRSVWRPPHPVTVGLIAGFNSSDRTLACLLLEALEAEAPLEDFAALLAGLANSQ